MKPLISLGVLVIFGLAIVWLAPEDSGVSVENDSFTPTVSTTTPTVPLPLPDISNPKPPDKEPLPPEKIYPSNPPNPTIGSCRVTGCSSELCTDIDVYSTCQYKPEYACYKTARCEKQSNGLCGWTETPELNQCLASQGGSLE